MEINKRVEKLYGFFPDQMCIGGSWAWTTAWKSRAFKAPKPSDIDIFISGRLTREALLGIIELCFGEITMLSPRDGHHKQYRMPGLRKRISFRCLEDDTKYDVMVIDPCALPDGSLSDYLLKYQASSMSEVCLKLGFGIDSRAKYIVLRSDNFNSIDTSKVIKLNTHPDVCTEEHRKKVEQFARDNNLYVVLVPPKPYNVEEKHNIDLDIFL